MGNEKINQQIEEIKKTIPEKRSAISFQDLEQIIGKWLLIKDKGIIKVVTGIVIANKLSTDPVWLFIVAASGGTKTELIRGLNKIDGIYPISDLTPNTFLSGQKGENGSLLLRLQENTILTYKDFTTVLTMHRDKRHAILSQLREIYDGYYRKEFGTGETKTWEGKLGFIAGVTSVIDNHQSVFQVLGERFVQYRPQQPDSILLAKKAISHGGHEKQMREEIQNAFADFITSVEIPEGIPLLSDEITDRIAHLATLCVRARSGVIREGYSNREIELIPDPELPTRLAKQLITLITAFSLIDNSDPENNYELIYKIGMDSLSHKRKLALEIVTASNEELETSDVATKINYPTNTTRRILEDLHGLGLITRKHQGKGHSDKWLASEYTRGLLEKATPPRLKSQSQKTSTKETTLPEMSEDQKFQEEIKLVL